MSKFEASFTRVTNTDNDLYAMLVDVASQRGDAEAIAKYAPLAEQEALENGHILHQAVAHRAWGVYHRLGKEYDESSVRLHKALDIFRSLGTRWQIGRTYLELGETSLGRNEKGAAHAHFEEALKAFEDMRAYPSINKVKAILETLDR